jgi:hypothetical protein
MTVISVEPKYGGLSGSGSLEGVREYTKVYIVTTDAVSDGVITVGNALGLPRKGWVYTWQGETDAGALCHDVNPVQDQGNHFVWEVTCLYSSNLGGSGALTKNDPRFDVDNPLSAPPEVTWQSWEEIEVVTFDQAGKAVLNAAGLPFDPPLTRRTRQRSVTIVRNEATYPAVLDRDYLGAINSDLFYDWPPLTAMLEDLTATAKFSQNRLYWRVRYEIRFRKSTQNPDWRQRTWDAGRQHFKRDADGLLETVDDITGSFATLKLFNPTDDGVVSTNVVFLNEDGTRMSQEDVKKGKARLLVFQVDPDKPFSALNL